MLPIFTIGSLSVPTFFIVISLSLSFLVIYLSYRIDQFSVIRRTVARAAVYDIAIVLMVAGFIGGRMMHVFYEEWPFYQKYPIQILYFWQGGYVFFGGFVVATLSAYFYCRIKKIDFLMMADFFAPLLSLAHALGRLGCFFSGCCYGAKCDLPWAIEQRHPTTLYLMGGELLIFAYLIFFEKWIYRKNRAALDGPIDSEHPPSAGLKGSVLFKWVLLHSLLRLFVEYLRDDFRGAFYHWPLLGRLSISQSICVFLIFISCGFFIIQRSRMMKLRSHPPSSH